MDETRLLIKLKRYHYGKENAASSKELEVAFLVSGKKIRDAVNALRQDGQPICSDSNGYYYAIDAHELHQSIHQLGNRITSIAKAQRGLIKAASVFDSTEQTSLPL